jgi:hypothetical protein
MAGWGVRLVFRLMALRVICRYRAGKWSCVGRIPLYYIYFRSADGNQLKFSCHGIFCEVYLVCCVHISKTAARIKFSFL